MTINHQEILSMLESHDPNTELSAGIQRRQDLIRKIMHEQNPDQTKDLITIAQDFKELMNLDENELTLRYLRKKYPDFEFEFYNGGIASLSEYYGNTIAEFPPGLKDLYMWDCPNIETLPEFPPSLKSLYINDCENLESIPELPTGLEKLSVKTCPKLENVPEFPSSLERLRIESCLNLTQETRDRIKEFQG